MAFQCIKRDDKGRSCGYYVHKCKKCNAAGCNNKNCSNQNFDYGNGRCFACGNRGV